MFTNEEYTAARKMLAEDANLLQHLHNAIPWGSIWQLSQMSTNPDDSHWGWDYMTFRPSPQGGYIRTCGYGSRFERTHDKIVLISCSKHRVEVTLTPDGRIIKINSGLDESSSSFGHSFNPAARARIIGDRLRKAGLRVAANATAEVEEKWEKLSEVKRFLTKTGPERPNTLVRKALARWPEWAVIEIASRLWPVSYKKAA